MNQGQLISNIYRQKDHTLQDLAQFLYQTEQ
jgi:hypothetical protein